MGERKSNIQSAFFFFLSLVCSTIKNTVFPVSRNKNVFKVVILPLFSYWQHRENKTIWAAQIWEHWEFIGQQSDEINETVNFIRSISLTWNVVWFIQLNLNSIKTKKRERKIYKIYTLFSLFSIIFFLWTSSLLYQIVGNLSSQLLLIYIYILIVL